METIKDDGDVGINRTISIFKGNGNTLMMKEKIGNISKGIETKEQIRNWKVENIISEIKILPIKIFKNLIFLRIKTNIGEPWK